MTTRIRNEVSSKNSTNASHKFPSDIPICVDMASHVQVSHWYTVYLEVDLDPRPCLAYRIDRKLIGAIIIIIIIMAAALATLRRLSWVHLIVWWWCLWESHRARAIWRSTSCWPGKRWRWLHHQHQVVADWRWKWDRLITKRRRRNRALPPLSIVCGCICSPSM